MFHSAILCSWQFLSFLVFAFVNDIIIWRHSCKKRRNKQTAEVLMMCCLFSVFRHECFISHRLRNLNLRLRSVNICVSLLLGTTNNISFDVLFKLAILETESLAFYPSNVEGLEIGMKCSIFYFCKTVLNFFSMPHLPSTEEWWV